MSDGARLECPADLLARVSAAARAADPEECCGLLIGRRHGARWIVEGLEPSANVAPPPRTRRFEIDPALLLRAQRAARLAGRAVIGLYHSHPDGTAEPSAEDARRAWQPDQVWLIAAAPHRGSAPELRAWLRGPGAAATFAPMVLCRPAVAATSLRRPA